MRRSGWARVLPLLLPFLGACATGPEAKSDDGEVRPRNVVILFADDLGYGDVGCFGAWDIRTPNLDRIAAEGLRLTDFLVAAPSCSPSRAALLTGCYPQRVSVPHVLNPASKDGLHPDEVTLAEVLKARGFATACVGKWHLGLGELLPTRQGFDSYFGLPYSNDMSPAPANNPRAEARKRNPPLPLYRGATVIETEPDQSLLAGRYAAEATAFIRAHRDQPFFLYLAHSFPHVPLFASERFRGKSARGLYGDVVEETDWLMGEVLAALRETGQEEDTLVVFTSDNGPWLIMGEHAGSAGPLREGKATCFEGGQRVPCLVRWPRGIRPGGTSAELVTALDLLPTIAALAGAPLPEGRRIDGRDVSALIRAGRAPPEPGIFHYYNGTALHAVREGRWKLHVPHPYVSIEGARTATATDGGAYVQKRQELALYDLEADLGETTDVQMSHPKIVSRLLDLAESARADLGDSLTKRTGAGVRPAGSIDPAR